MDAVRFGRTERALRCHPFRREGHRTSATHHELRCGPAEAVMRTSQRAGVAHVMLGLIGLGLAFAAPVPRAGAAEYTFRKIASEADGLSWIAPPRINDRGEAAFVAQFHDSTFDVVVTVIFGPDGYIAYNFDGTIDNFGFDVGPSINNSGEVAFYAQTVDAKQHVYKYIPSQPGLFDYVSTVSSPGGISAVFHPWIGNSGSIVYGVTFSASDTSPEMTGLYSGSFPWSLAPTDEEVFGFPHINSTDGVAYVGSRGLYRNSVLLQAKGGLFFDFGQPTINDRHDVAFAGFDAQGGHPIYIIPSGQTAAILFTGPEFVAPRFPHINNHGDVAFLEYPGPQNPMGVFVGPDRVQDKVIARFDPLFEGIVEDLDFNRGFNNRGQVGFWYHLGGANSFGIAIATPRDPAAVANGDLEEFPLVFQAAGPGTVTTPTVNDSTVLQISTDAGVTSVSQPIQTLPFVPYVLQFDVDQTTAAGALAVIVNGQTIVTVDAGGISSALGPLDIASLGDFTRVGLTFTPAPVDDQNPNGYIQFAVSPGSAATFQLDNVVFRPVPVPADYDGDGDVDADDRVLLRACSTGPAIPYDPSHLPAGCMLTPDGDGKINADLDRDADVDQSDFGIFQRCWSGSGDPADPNCAS